MVTLSGFLVMGFPTTGLSALFSEIADSLDLDLVQIGVIWGSGSVMGIFTALVGGSLIDQFGTRRTLVALCLATGIFGATRAFAFDFWSLFVSSFFFGMVQPILPMNFVKLNREWFRSGQLGLRFRRDVGRFRHRLDAGLALERHGVIAAAGRLAARADFPRLLRHRACDPLGNCASAGESGAKARVRICGKIIGNYRYVARFRELWVIALAVFGVLGVMRGLGGYVPTYLREIGWEAASADTAMTVFFFCSLIGVVPISHFSDRLGNRRLVMAFGTSMMTIGCALMYFVGGSFLGCDAGDGGRRLLLRQLHGA